MGNVFNWILIAFPVFLLMRGKLPEYFALATNKNPSVSATKTANDVSINLAPLSPITAAVKGAMTLGGNL